MVKRFLLILQIAAVFIGTVVGAGLASGQEICQFFTVFGYKSFIGIFLCLGIYIFMGFIVIDISLKHKLSSYDSLISLVSPGFLGSVTNFLTTFFLISSSAVILAGSGALINQYFGVSKWIGISIMVCISLYTLFKDTNGLIQINSFIVPSLIIVILTIFILYIGFFKDIDVAFLKTIPHYKNHWFFSSLIYGGFNILCCTGVLVPLCLQIKNKKNLLMGITLGSLGLTLLAVIINFLLLLNVPYIFKYEIPLIYIAHRFGKIIQVMLLIIIWLEMFSTEVSNVYSVGKTFEDMFHISYKKSVILIIIIALPISQIGFVRLISVVYPAFAVISFIFMVQCIMFYLKH